MKKLMLVLFALALILTCSGCSELTEYVESEISEYIGKETAETSEPEVVEEKPDPAAFLNEGVSDEEVKEKIFAVFTEINLNPKFAKGFEKIEDETGTEKYSLLYRNNIFTVTLDENSEVYSVQVGEDGVYIYLKDNKSDDIDNYVSTEEMKRSLDWYIYSGVMISFNPPDGKYELADDWVYKHDDIFYYAKGTVFVGEGKKEHSMEVIGYYERDKKEMQFYRLVADGKEIVLSEVYQQYEKPEREPDFGD